MKIIFALGNPGSQYDGTRHNIGFKILDSYAEENKLKWSNKSKFSALVAEVKTAKETVLLAKPSTFYNETGVSARQLIDFYNLDAKNDILVIHDDLALPLGTVRTRVKGSDAGNNGVKSLTSHIGPNYHRLRVGIYNNLRDRMDDSDFVLGSFSKEESSRLNKTVIPHVLDVVDNFCNKGIEITSKNL